MFISQFIIEPKTLLKREIKCSKKIESEILFRSFKFGKTLGQKEAVIFITALSFGFKNLYGMPSDSPRHQSKSRFYIDQLNGVGYGLPCTFLSMLKKFCNLGKDKLIGFEHNFSLNHQIAQICERLGYF